jgi:proline iminopeptidase
MHGGLGYDHTFMHPWLDLLDDVMHLVYYDHRGNGRSDRPPIKTLTPENLCADADALREYLNFEKIAILGHSFGGLLAMEYALCYPEKVSHLILIDTIAQAPANYAEEIIANIMRKGATEEMMAELQGPPLENDADMERRMRVVAPLYFHEFDEGLYNNLSKHTVWNALAAAHSAALIRDYDIKSSLGDIQAPTLVIVGDDDFIVPISQARTLQQGIPDAEIAIIEDSGHFSYIEKPQDFKDAICQWLSRMNHLPQ